MTLFSRLPPPHAVCVLKTSCVVVKQHEVADVYSAVEEYLVHHGLDRESKSGFGFVACTVYMLSSEHCSLEEHLPYFV